MLKVKEYSSFEAFEQDEHRQDVDLVAIVNKPNGMVCADLITDCKMWQTAVNRFFKALAGMSALMAGRMELSGTARTASSRTRKSLTASIPAVTSGRLKTSMAGSTSA